MITRSGGHRAGSRHRLGKAATTHTVLWPTELRRRPMVICASMVLAVATAYASAQPPAPASSNTMPAPSNTVPGAVPAPPSTPAPSTTKPPQRAPAPTPSPSRAKPKPKPNLTATKLAAPSPPAAVVRPSEAPAPKAAPAAPPPQPDTPPAPAGATLKEQLDAIIAVNGRYQLGVALVDMSNGVVRQYGVREKFVAASTGKILAAATYYHLAEAGVVSLEAPMGGNTAAIQIRQMIQQSSNTAWALIVGAVGYSGIHDYAASLGIPYDRTFNTLSPAETATLLTLLYTGRLLNAAHTAELLSYMQNTNYETLIPAAVPPGVTVFHKYGLLNGNLHDASILVQGPRAYAFVVYSLGASSAERPVQATIIRQLTQTVVDHLF